MPAEFVLRTGVLTFLLSLLLGSAVALWVQGRRSPLNRLLAFTLMLLSLWQLAGFLQTQALPDTLHPLQMCFATLAALAFFQLTRQMIPGASTWPARLAWSFGLLFCAGYMLMAASAAFDAAWFPSDLHAITSWIHTSSLAMIFSAGIASGLYARTRVVEHALKARITGISLGIGVSALTSILVVNVFHYLDVAAPFAVERVVVVVALISLGMAVLHEQAASGEHLLRVIREKEKGLAERNRIIESELDMARLIHDRLFPARPPRIPGYDIYGACISTDKVGGDFYDFYTRIDNLGIFVADVSGHGIPAAFIASCTKMAFNYSAAHSENGSTLLKKMDVAIARRSVQSMYVTAVYAEIDYDTRVLHYATGGHIPFLLHRRKENRFFALKASGTPLGLATGKPFELKSMQLQTGDRIVLFTDGITESTDASGRPFGEEHLKQLISRYAAQSPENLVKHVLQAVPLFTGRPRLDDDSTIVVIDILEPQDHPGETRT